MMMSQSGGDAAGNGGKPEATTGQASGGPTSFAEIVDLLDVHKEAILSGEVSDFVRPVSCENQTLIVDVKERAPGNLLTRLADFLFEVTDQDWDVLRSDEKADTETLKERRIRVREERMNAAAAHPGVKEALALFEGAELVDVQNEMGDEPLDNVVPLDPKMAAKG